MLTVTLCVSSSQALEFRIVGPRAFAMGGASVACPAPGYAAYYNPAALGLEPDTCAFDLTGGGNVRDTGISAHLDSLANYDWQTAINDPLGEQAEGIIAELATIRSSDGLMFLPSGAFGIKAGPFGTGAYPAGQIVMASRLDTVHISQADPLLDANSFFYNESTMYAKGLGVLEVPFAYGYTFQFEEGTLSVGAAVKFIGAMTYNVDQGITLTAEPEQIRNELEDSAESTVGFGIDLGLLYRTMEDRLSMGLLARNINSPSFKTHNGDDISDDAQVRAGIAYAVTEEVMVALDVDLTANDTLIDDYSSRQVSAGLCYDTGGLALRVGVMKNIDESSAPVMVCLGFSLGNSSFHLDVAGSLPGSWETFDDYSYPSEGGLMISLGGGW